MRVDAVTVFPDYLAPLGLSLLGKAQQRGLLDVHVHDLRQWTTDVHRTVDDSPYGGGPGMVMTPEPWRLRAGARRAARRPACRVLVVPTPGGRPFTQALAAELARRAVAGLRLRPLRGHRRPGRCEHAARRMPVLEVSLGDYVLAGGEVAVLVVVEAVARLLPGVLGNAASVTDDSFSGEQMAGLIEAPSYTRPPVWQGLEVPAVLLSGDHAAVARWRRDEALRRTAAAPPRPARGAGRPARASRPGGARAAPGGRCGRVEGCCGAQLSTSGRPRSDLRRTAPHLHEKATAMHTLDELDAAQLRSDLPDFRPGDTLDVGVRVVEGNRSRVQRFQGVVIRRQGGGVRETFTIRKVSFGVGVERTFPVHTPVIEDIKVVTRGDVRRAKLYYLRELRGKKAKIKEKRETVAPAKAAAAPRS